MSSVQNGTSLPWLVLGPQCPQGTEPLQGGGQGTCLSQEEDTWEMDPSISTESCPLIHAEVADVKP